MKHYLHNKAQRKEFEEQQRLLEEKLAKASRPLIQLELDFGGTPLPTDPDTIDIACTATRRPAVIDNTFRTFSERFFKKHPTRLFINIDPIGESCKDQTIIDIGKKYFDEVYANTPSKPSFFKAFKWAITSCNSKYVFHLQDDWLLTKDHDVDDFIGYLESNASLACVRMPFRVKTEGTMMNDVVRIGTRYYDHPALWKRAFWDEIMPYFNTDYGTEFQIRGKCPENSADMTRICEKWCFGVYHSGGSSIKDIGREWLGAAGFMHKNNTDVRGGYLTRWTKKRQ